MRFSVLLLVAFSTILSSCAGTGFSRLESHQLSFATDTKESIIQKMGNPDFEGSLEENGKFFETKSYIYGNPSGEAAYEDVIPQRYQSFIFFEGRLVGHEFSSSWNSDLTDFNHFNLSKIEEGVSTLRESVTLFGDPGGGYVYPLTGGKSEKASVYLYSQIKKTGFMSSSAQFKKLIITYDENEIIVDVDYSAAGTK